MSWVGGQFLSTYILSNFIIFLQRSLSTSRRSSVTTNFMAEETKREKELERILANRLNDLELSTKNVLTGLPTR